MSKLENNPFWVQTPESIPANEAMQLFVDLFTEFGEVESAGHSFISGPRGSGKSMMFRMMHPDCLMLRHAKGLSELPYLGIYVPVKSTRITATEMIRLDEHPARHVFNEHLLCLYIAIAAFNELAKIVADLPNQCDEKILSEWTQSYVVEGLEDCGASGNEVAEFGSLPFGHAPTFLASIAKLLNRKFWSVADTLLRHLALRPEGLANYSGPLLSYHGFLYPLLTGLRQLPFLPDAPVYLLIDDADNLNLAQTEVVNSWLATRSTENVCLKLSDQLGYKTLLTYGGKRIQPTHDYNEVDISVLYTTQKDKYLERLEQIIAKRLEIAGIDVKVRDFFPEDEKQKERLRVISEELKEAWSRGEGKGNRQRDDVTRYARPELMRSLGGDTKQRSKYSYAGFEQLAHISSGVIRYFLEPAATMYTKQQSTGAAVTKIDPPLQDSVIKEFSNDFLDKELVTMRRDAGARADDYEKLRNLIEVLGNSFADRLLDAKRTERRVFSIVLSDRPDTELERILDLGCREGFFYRSSLGAKRGSGRVPRYVLSRRLAPRFKLDPTSFAGYLSVTCGSLKQALANSNHRLRDTELDKGGQLPLEGITELSSDDS